MAMIKVQKIKEALVDFCMEQSEYDLSERTVRSLVDSAFDVMCSYPHDELPSQRIQGYTVFRNGKERTELFDDDTYYDVEVCTGVLLGTFAIDSDEPGECGILTFARGYDIVYDPVFDEIRILFIIAAEGLGVMSAYRFETSNFVDFDLYGFVIGLAAQICRKLL